MEKAERCSLKWVSDGRDWKIELHGDCQEIMSLIDSLPPLKKGYLKRRTDIIPR